MAKYKPQRNLWSKDARQDEDTRRPSTTLTFVSGKAERGYSWIIRSLSLYSRPSSVLYHPQPEPVPPKEPRRYGRRKAAKETDVVEREQNQRFWEKTKQYFAEVDAFELTVESPTPFRHRNRPPDERELLTAVEEQRQGLQHVPEKLSIAAAIQGLLRPEESTSDDPSPEKCRETSQMVVIQEEPCSTPEKRSLSVPVETPLALRQPSSVQEELQPQCSAHEEISIGEKENSPVEKDPFQALLNACCQSELSRETLPSMASLLETRLNIQKTVKIGEGAFGEAFKYESTVVKIVPFEGSLLICGYEQKGPEHLLPEVLVSHLLSNLSISSPFVPAPLRLDPGQKESRDQHFCSGFAHTHDAKVCHGPYPQTLSQEWHRWGECYGTENDPVANFPSEQLFLVFFIEDGGSDLERYPLKTFSEVRSMLLQVSMSLAVAEAAYQFEHRDLHLGNILLSRTHSNSCRVKLKGQEIEISTEGLHVVLIDFSLSRIDSGSMTIFKDLNLEPEIFTGPARDPQAETYRRMRKAVKDDWQGYCAQTNCLWLNYLADAMMTVKKLPLSTAEKQDLRLFKSLPVPPLHSSVGCL